MFSPNAIKQISNFLDPHILLYLLNKNCGPDSVELQNQIKSKLLLNQKDLATKIEENSKQEASKLVNLIDNMKEVKRLRDEHKFTLETLKKEKEIELSDCRKLQNYAKVLYESGRYADAEKYLFSLKEILANESQNNLEFVLQVFWGLLSCQILNNKGRDNIENTTLRKMRELLQRKYGATEGIKQVGASQEHAQVYTWLLHWLLVYSFTAGDLTNTGLFATIIADPKKDHGSYYLNVIEMKPDSLSQYMFAALLLSRGQPYEKYKIPLDTIEKIAFPIALQESVQGKQSTALAQFLVALFEDYDLDKALQLVEKVSAEASQDIFLHKYTLDIKKQAYILVLEMKAKLYRQVTFSEMTTCFDQIMTFDSACEEIQARLVDQGYEVSLDQNSLTCLRKETLVTSEALIRTQTYDLFEKTRDLTEQYKKQKEKVQSE